MPSAYKSKGKGRDARQSRSRNTTPSNAGSVVPPLPSYLENDVTKLIDLANGQYTELLDLVAGPNIPDSKTLETLVEHLKSLSDMADARGEMCNAGMREMSQKRKEVMEDAELSREVGDRAKLKRETEEDEEIPKGKTKKRKDRASAKEERPLSHGAHGVARQDGAETKVEGGECTARGSDSSSLLNLSTSAHDSTFQFSSFTLTDNTDSFQLLLQSPKSRRTRVRTAARRFHLHPCSPPTALLPGPMAMPNLPNLGHPDRTLATALISPNRSQPCPKSKSSGTTRLNSMIRRSTTFEMSQRT